jgi:hypothetical protein
VKFRPEPWAEAFINAAGSAAVAEEAMEHLRAYCCAALRLPGDISGRNDADRLGRRITAALGSAGAQTTSKKDGMDAANYASRFIQLMIRKRRFNYYKEIIREIEKAIENQKGIKEVILETAETPDAEILEASREEALRLTGAKGVKLVSRVIPELIGGIRLRWGSTVLDGSIKWRLDKMAAAIGNLNDGFAQRGGITKNGTI